MPINTGVGGFDIDGKTYVYDVGDPLAPGVDPVPSDSGDIHVDKSKRDISKKTKTTLSQYLKSLTQKNAYPLDPASQESSLSDENGNPTPISKEPTNDPQFADPSQPMGPVHVSPGLTSWPGEPLNDPSIELLGKLKKGKSSGQGTDDGNSLLKGVSSTSLPQPVRAYVPAVLKKNRFSSSATLAASTKLRIPNVGEFSHGQLANVAGVLSARASQELSSADDKFDPNSESAGASAMLPSPNQLGVTKVDVALLSAKDVLEKLIDNEVTSFSSINSESWGALNNISDGFSGLNNVGMIALSVALVAAVETTFGLAGVALDTVPADIPAPTKDAIGAYIKGSYRTSSTNKDGAFADVLDVKNMLGIPSSIHPFGRALRAGVMRFFGIDDSSALSVVSSGLRSSATSAGFNVVVARSIVRSTLSIKDAVSKLASSRSVVSGVAGILGVIDMIKSSKIMSAIRVFVVLGDIVLSEQAAFDQNANNEFGQSLDSITAASAKRLPGSLGLSWSSNRSPASYLIPETIAASSIIQGGLFGAPNTGVTNSGLRGKNTDFTVAKLANSSRISHEDVVAFESKLDAEYVPFYFHDLRTNEIISFHAFLAGLTDDYAVGWDNVDGMGRVDPVKIYKNTARKIGMSFYVAATNPADFDDMWVKLNKLTTLLYPQYSKGRLLTDGTTQFIQPFSQVISSSPVIRLRLGDLLKSNYSRFALARLFGMTDGSMKLKSDESNGKIVSLPNVKNVDKLKAISAVIEEWKVTAKSRSGWVIRSSQVYSQLAGMPGFVGNALSSAPFSPRLDPRIIGEYVSYIDYEIITVLNDGRNAVVTPKVVDADELYAAGYHAAVVSGVLTDIDSKLGESAPPAKRIIGGLYVVPLEDLQPSDKLMRKILRDDILEGKPEDFDETFTTLQGFFSPEKNAIVKSFKSTSGKGLAGVIETMNFDWYDRVTWETTPGRTAPKMCKITLSFSPIHDISPGLDHMGYNRAPVYPVGLMNQRRDDH